jgi:hypothetical protein
VIPDAGVLWSSSAAAIVAVSSDGVARGVAEGTGTITATSGTASAGVTFTVSGSSNLRIDGSRTYVPGSEAPLTAVTFDAATHRTVALAATWATSDASVATISADGLVTAGRAGTATITASTGLGVVRSDVTTRPLPGRLAFVRDGRRIALMSLDGTAPAELTGYDVAGAGSVSLSPKATSIAYDCASGVCAAVLSTGRVEQVELYYDGDGTNLSWPGWVADGSTLFVQYSRSGWAVTPPEQASMYQTWETNFAVRRPRRSSDGLVIFECAFVTSLGAPTDLCLARGLSPITLFAAGATSVAFSPGRDRVSYDTPGALCTARVTAPTCSRVLAHPVSVAVESVWSPDGASIAFTRDGELWLMDATGDNLVRLAPAMRTRGAITSPSWAAGSDAVAK